MIAGKSLLETINEHLVSDELRLPVYSPVAARLQAIANDATLLYTSRGRFVEYDVLVKEMPRYLRTQFIGREDLLRGNWAPALEKLLSQPPPPEKPALNGAEVAAEEILRQG